MLQNVSVWSSLTSSLIALIAGFKCSCYLVTSIVTRYWHLFFDRIFYCFSKIIYLHLHVKVSQKAIYWKMLLGPVQNQCSSSSLSEYFPLPRLVCIFSPSLQSSFNKKDSQCFLDGSSLFPNMVLVESDSLVLRWQAMSHRQLLDKSSVSSKTLLFYMSLLDFGSQLMRFSHFLIFCLSNYVSE